MYEETYRTQECGKVTAVLTATYEWLRRRIPNQGEDNYLVSRATRLLLRVVFASLWVNFPGCYGIVEDFQPKAYDAEKRNRYQASVRRNVVK